MSVRPDHAPTSGLWRLKHNVVALNALLCLFVSAAFVGSLMLGPEGFGLPAGGEALRLVFVEIRLPRALLGVLVGGALGLAGATLQGYLRNPLAEPGLLGMAGGASLGAVIAIHSGAAGLISLALPLGGLAGAGIATLAVVLLAGKGSAEERPRRGPEDSQEAKH